MGQKTSALWTKLFRMRDTTREYQFDIAGIIYGPESEISHSVDAGLYEEFGIGNAATAKLTLTLYASDIPRGAAIKRYIRLRNQDQVSEWLLKGVFFTSRRTEDDGQWTIDAFDAMHKAERVWVPEESLVFPLTMPDAVMEFARLIGVEMDPRTRLNPAYIIDYPYENDYTIRDELRFIAAAHGGNWIITDEGRLLLVPLLSAPPETHYLITQFGDAITLGGVKLLV